MARGTRVRIPSGSRLDLNSTAKAWCADVAAQHAHGATGEGVLVGLCGDIAVAGEPPPGGWSIRCGDDHRDPDTGRASDICISSGGLATSSITVRIPARRNPAGPASHILNPHSLTAVTGPWRTVSVVAADCVQANAASTAALVKGDQAVDWLESLGLPARLVRTDGHVHTTRGWPE